VSDWHHSGVVKIVNYLLLAFFFGFVVDLVPLVALLPLVDLETLAPFVVDLGVDT